MTSQPDPTRHEASPPHTFDSEPARVAVEMNLESMWVAQVRRLLAHYGLHGDVSVDALVAVAAGAVPPAGAVADRARLLGVTSSTSAGSRDLMDGGELRAKYAEALASSMWPWMLWEELSEHHRDVAFGHADAVLAVRDAEVERLRAEVEANRVSAKAWKRMRDRAESAEARLAAVEALRERWEGYGHGEFNVHPEENLPCRVCDVLAEVDAALASVPAVDAGEDWTPGPDTERVLDDLAERSGKPWRVDAGDREPASEVLAEAWDAGHAFTGFRPERGENPYRREEDAR